VAILKGKDKGEVNNKGKYKQEKRKQLTRSKKTSDKGNKLTNIVPKQNLQCF